MKTPSSDLPDWIQLGLLVIPALSAAFAAIGLLLNVRQSRKTDAQNRAVLVANCLKGFTEDEEIQKAFYLVEYSEFRYGDDFHGSAQERIIDKLLRHFANIALAWQTGLLSKQDVMPIKYYLVRIMFDDDIQEYMKFMERWTKQSNTGEHPYLVLQELAQELDS